MYIDEKPVTLPAPAEPGLAPGEPAPTPGGADGQDVANRVGGHLEYLSRLARDLGVPDPVEEYFAPVVGRWSDMEAEAGRWRAVGDAAAEVTDTLNKPLGRLDAAWDGEAATSFIAYMQKFGLAGQDLSDATHALADVLEITAEGIREIVQQMGGVLTETAESASQAMVMPVQGDERTRQFLDVMRRPTKELFESVRQVLEAFVQMCEGIDGGAAFQQIKMAHSFPEDNWSFGTPAGPDGKTPATGVDPKTDKAGADVPGGGGSVPSGFGGGGGGSGLSGLGGSNMSPGGYTVATEQAPLPRETTAAAAAASAGGSGTTGRGAGGMMPMAPMMGMGMGQGQGGDHKSRTRIVGDPQDIFGKPEKASAPVIGDDDY